ncbi:MAG TPA: hypothetical protein VLA24_11340, partial [Pseudomonadales bacterium]|nr:hypothetical protein [Pseudomonadales bacterium]
KRFIADGSVGSPHVRVGHRQASKTKTPAQHAGVFLCLNATPAANLCINWRHEWLSFFWKFKKSNSRKSNMEYQ